MMVMRAGCNPSPARHRISNLDRVVRAHSGPVLGADTLSCTPSWEMALPPSGNFRCLAGILFAAVAINATYFPPRSFIQATILCMPVLFEPLSSTTSLSTSSS
jgi:hypothetical protein